MLKQIATILIVSSILSVIAESANSYGIIGGHDAKLGQFPYQVALQALDNNTYFTTCGGAILNPSWILTAASCYPNLLTYRIFAGSIESNGTNVERQERNVVKAIIHPDFKEGDNSANDIALLQLDKPLEFNKFVSAVVLPGRDSNPAGIAVVAGWGSVKLISYEYPNRLQFLRVPILPHLACEYAFTDEYVKETELCVGFLIRKPCVGDNGSPLVQNGRVVGLFSFGGEGCLFTKPTVYTKVSSYIDFIEQHIQPSN